MYTPFLFTHLLLYLYHALTLFWSINLLHICTLFFPLLIIPTLYFSISLRRTYTLSFYYTNRLYLSVSLSHLDSISLTLTHLTFLHVYNITTCTLKRILSPWNSLICLLHLWSHIHISFLSHTRQILTGILSMFISLSFSLYIYLLIHQALSPSRRLTPTQFSKRNLTLPLEFKLSFWYGWACPCLFWFSSSKFQQDSNSDRRSRKPSVLPLCHQRDQMVPLFFQYFAIYNNENLPKKIKLAQIVANT